MEKSEVIIFLNSSTHTTKSENASGLHDGYMLENKESHVTKLKDFISNKSGNGNEAFINSMDFGNNFDNNLSFTSTNSSIVGKSDGYSERNNSETNGNNNNNNLRNLFCHVLTKLDELEDQLEIERENYEIMKNKYDKKFKNLKIMNDNLSEDIDDIFDDLYTLDTRLIHCEQYSRRESIVISGIPDSIPQRELEPVVLNILKGIGLDRMSSFEISACHRLFKKRNNRFPAKTIVKFTNRKLAEFCFHHRDRLLHVSEQFQMKLRFEESLCEANRNVIKMCKNLSNYGFIKEYCVIRGSVRITKTDETKQYKIKHPNVMFKIFKDFYDYEDLYLT